MFCVLSLKKSIQKIQLNLDALGQLDMTELPRQSGSGIRNKTEITLFCAGDLIQCFDIDAHLDAAKNDLNLQKLLLERQMQKQHQIDLKQCYYDWTQDTVKVYVMSRDVIDQAIATLPACYQDKVVGICPHSV